MDTIILLILFAIAAIYLYYKLFKNKGCGCGKSGCTKRK